MPDTVMDLAMLLLTHTDTMARDPLMPSQRLRPMLDFFMEDTDMVLDSDMPVLDMPDTVTDLATPVLDTDTVLDTPVLAMVMVDTVLDTEVSTMVKKQYFKA